MTAITASSTSSVSSSSFSSMTSDLACMRIGENDSTDLKELLRQKNTTKAKQYIEKNTKQQSNWWNTLRDQRTPFKLAVDTRDIGLILCCIKSGVLLADLEQEPPRNQTTTEHSCTCQSVRDCHNLLNLFQKHNRDTLWDYLIDKLGNAFISEIINVSPLHNKEAIESLLLVFIQQFNHSNDHKEWFIQLLHRLHTERPSWFDINNASMQTIFDLVIENSEDETLMDFLVDSQNEQDLAFAIALCEYVMHEQHYPTWWSGLLKAKIFYAIACRCIENKKALCEQLVPEIVDVEIDDNQGEHTLLEAVARAQWHDLMLALLQRRVFEIGNAFSLLQKPSDALYNYLTTNYLTEQKIAQNDKYAKALLHNRDLFHRYVAALFNNNHVTAAVIKIMDLFESTSGILFWETSNAPRWWNQREDEPSDFFISLLKGRRDDLALRIVSLTKEKVFAPIIALYQSEQSERANRLLNALWALTPQKQPDWWGNTINKTGLQSINYSFTSNRERALRRYFSNPSLSPLQVCQAIGLRCMRLLETHHQWNMTLLRRAINQFQRMTQQIPQIAQSEDISLGQISALLRQNLSSEEERHLTPLITQKSGVMARKIIARSEATLQAKIQAVIQNYIATEDITTENIQQLISVKLTHNQAQTYLNRLHIKNSQTTAPDDFKAIEQLVSLIYSSWTQFERSSPVIEKILPIALYAHKYFRSQNRQAQTIARLINTQESHLSRSIVVLPSKTAVAILAKKAFRKRIGDPGSTKAAYATILIYPQKGNDLTNNANSIPLYGFINAVRLMSLSVDTIEDCKLDALFSSKFQNKHGFLPLYGTLERSKSFSAFWPRGSHLGTHTLSSLQHLYIMRDILSAIATLHKAHQYHFDVKTQNIVYMVGENDKTHGFLIDFNLSGTLPVQKEYNQGFYGSIVYTAPELFQHRSGKFTGNHAACENFAVGTTFYMMLRGYVGTNWKEAPWEEPVHMNSDRGIGRARAIFRMQQELENYHRSTEAIVNKVSRGEGITHGEFAEYITSRLLLADPRQRWTAATAFTCIQDALEPL